MSTISSLKSAWKTFDNNQRNLFRVPRWNGEENLFLPPKTHLYYSAWLRSEGRRANIFVPFCSNSFARTTTNAPVCLFRRSDQPFINKWARTTSTGLGPVEKELTFDFPFNEHSSMSWRAGDHTILYKEEQERNSEWMEKKEKERMRAEEKSLTWSIILFLRAGWRGKELERSRISSWPSEMGDWSKYALPGKFWLKIAQIEVVSYNGESQRLLLHVQYTNKGSLFHQLRVFLHCYYYMNILKVYLPMAWSLWGYEYPKSRWYFCNQEYQNHF